MGATERIPVLVTSEEKARIAQSASEAGMSMGEYLRKAAAAFDTADDEVALNAMIEQMNLATERAEAAIDDALEYIDQSNNRIAETEARYRAKSGSGNVAIHAISKIQSFGGNIVACSDSDGYIVDDAGINLELLHEIKTIRRGRIAEYVELKGSGAHYIKGGSIWDVPCEVAMPSATQNELTGTDARSLIDNGVVAVGEGANMPCTPEAVHLFQKAGVLFAPGKAANAGGVSTSALEMQQNASRDSWTFEQTETRLSNIMGNIHDACAETAEKYGAPGDYVLGANVTGFVRVAEAMRAMGVI